MALQEIGENYSLSRERVRQLLKKYLRRLGHPDILRYLNCGISIIPSRTSQTLTEKLKQLESNITNL
jgi:L-lysine 2,3-aminomutase